MNCLSNFSYFFRATLSWTGASWNFQYLPPCYSLYQEKYSSSLQIYPLVYPVDILALNGTWLQPFGTLHFGHNTSIFSSSKWTLTGWSWRWSWQSYKITFARFASLIRTIKSFESYSGLSKSASQLCECLLLSVVSTLRIPLDSKFLVQSPSEPVITAISTDIWI